MAKSSKYYYISNEFLLTHMLLLLAVSVFFQINIFFVTQTLQLLFSLKMITRVRVKRKQGCGRCHGNLWALGDGNRIQRRGRWSFVVDSQCVV